MSPEVIEDDANLLAGGAGRNDLTEEADEVAAGVAGCGLARHPAGLHLQRGVERRCGMAVILKTLALGASRREPQDRVETIQRLNANPCERQWMNVQ